MTSGQGARYSRLAMKPLQPMRGCSTALATAPGIFVGTTIPPAEDRSGGHRVTRQLHARATVAKRCLSRPVNRWRDHWV